MGRPSTFSQEIADAICDGLSIGKSLRTITADEGMPAQGTVFRWLAKHEDFREQYALAREAQADALFDEMLNIADDATNDFMESRDETGSVSWKLNGEHIQRSKLRIDARKWMASKLQPKKYGDKITQELTGAGGAPLVPVLNVTVGSARPEPASEAGAGPKHRSE